MRAQKVRARNVDTEMSLRNLTRPRLVTTSTCAAAALLIAACSAAGRSEGQLVSPLGSKVALPQSGSTTPGGSIGSVPSGTAVTITKPAYRVHIVVSIAAEPADPNTSSTGPRGGEYETASVTIRVLSGSFAYGLNYLRFVDRAGKVYRPIRTEDQAGAPLPPTGDAEEGETAGGVATFMVSTGGGEVEMLEPDGSRLWGWTIKK